MFHLIYPDQTVDMDPIVEDKITRGQQHGCTVITQFQLLITPKRKCEYLPRPTLMRRKVSIFLTLLAGYI